MLLIRSLVLLLLLLQVTLPNAALAERGQWAQRTGRVSAPAAEPQAAGGGFVGGAGQLNLDLSSSARNLNASAFLGAQSVTINVGGANRLISGGDMVTPAELVAASQVLANGMQSLKLGADGNAVRGSFSLTGSLASSVENLVVPHRVSFVQDFGLASTLSFSGNITNSGKVVAYSSTAEALSASISAANIYNQVGGLITSVLPAGMTSPVSSLNLSLSALGDIVNAGTIASSGSLNLYAGGSIVNALPQGVVGSAPSMFAANNLNTQAASITNAGQMIAQMGNVNAAQAMLTNTGVMQALKGSAMIQNLAGNSLIVENGGGLIAAANQLSFLTQGTVFGDEGQVLSKSSITLRGGDLSASALDFTTADGHIDVQANRIDGGVTVNGGTAFVGTLQGDLKFDDMNLTGDPIYYAAGGNLDISGMLSATGGEDFVALASGNITAVAPPSTVLDAQGGEITIAAGVEFSVLGGVSPIACSSCSGLFEITGRSITGGEVDMANVSLVTSGAGDITVQANQGTASTGFVTLDGLQANGVGTVSVTADSNVTLGPTPSVAGVMFTASSGNVLTTGGTITVGSGSVVLETRSGFGHIAIGDSITAFNLIEIAASGDGDINQLAGVLTAPSVVLSSNTGNIGSLVANIFTATNVLSANVVRGTTGIGVLDLGTQSVFIDNTSSNLTLNTCTAGLIGTLQVTQSGDLAVAGGAAVTADNILFNVGGSVSVGVGGRLEIPASSSTGGLTINPGTGVLVNNGLISAGSGTNFLMENLAGDINVSGSGTFGGSATLSSLITFNASGNVTINQASMDGLVEGSAGGTFDLTVVGGVLNPGNITAVGDLTITNVSADIEVGSGRSPTSTAGAVTISTLDVNSVITFVVGVPSALTDYTFNTGYFNNNGADISAGNQITFLNSGDLHIGGTGRLAAPNINFNSTNGQVLASQNVLEGTVNGISGSGDTENFVVYVHDDGLFVLGAVPVGATTLNPVYAGAGQAYISGNDIQTASGNDIAAVSSGTVSVTLGANLDITNNSGDMIVLVGVGTFVGGDITITGTGNTAIDTGTDGGSGLTGNSVFIQNSGGSLTLNGDATTSSSTSMTFDNSGGNMMFVAENGISANDITVTNTGGRFRLGFTGAFNSSDFTSVTNSGGDIFISGSMNTGTSLTVTNLSGGFTALSTGLNAGTDLVVSVTGGDILVASAAGLSASSSLLIENLGAGNFASNGSNIFGFLGLSINNSNGTFMLTGVTQINTSTGDIIITNSGGDMFLIGGAGIGAFDGMTSVSNTGGDLVIAGGTGIGSSTGLTSVTNIGGNFIVDSAAIGSFDGDTIVSNDGGSMTISGQASVGSGIASVTNIGGDLTISQESQVGFGSDLFLSNSGGSLNIVSLGNLSSIGNLAVLNDTGDVTIEAQEPLSANPNITYAKILSVGADATVFNDDSINITGNGIDQLDVGGTISLDADGGVSVLQGQIDSNVDGSSNSGFNLVATGGGLSLGDIFSNRDSTGDGGNVFVQAPGNIFGQQIDSAGGASGDDGGDISVISGLGLVGMTGTLRSDALGASAVGGNVYVSAATDVAVTTISAIGGGSVDLLGNTITASGSIDTSATPVGIIPTVETAGYINLLANGTINVGSLRAQANLASPTHLITVQSITGDVITGFIDSSAVSDGAGVAVDVSAGINIATGSINTSGQTSGNGGTVTLTTLGGSITTDFIDSSALGDDGDAGTVLITASVSIDGTSINAIGGALSGRGGDITLDATVAGGTITYTSFIDSRARGNDQGGNIMVTADSDVGLVSVNSIGGTASTGGGDIALVSNGASVTVATFVDSSAAAASGSPAANATAGTLTITAVDDISFGSLRANGGDAGGDGNAIIITSTGGNVIGTPYGVITVPFVDSSASSASALLNTGNGGAITVDAVDVGQTGTAPSFRADGGIAGGNGGDILFTVTGAMTTDFISSSAQPPSGLVTAVGDAGSIVVVSTGNVTIGNARAEGGVAGGAGGLIDIDSATGFINVTASVSTAAIGNGTAGLVDLSAATGISVGSVVRAFGLGAAGNGNNITLVTTGGGIILGFGATTSGTINAGLISMTAPGDIDLGLVVSATGASIGPIIVVNSTSGSVSSDLGGIISTSNLGSVDGGEISITANVNINIGASITADTDSGSGGIINLTAIAGSITLGSFVTSLANTTGSGNTIALTAATGISAVSLATNGGATSGDGGDISVSTTTGDMTFTSFVSSRARGAGAGGGINLTASAGLIAVLGVSGATGAAINSAGAGLGNGGDVNIIFGAAGGDAFVIDTLAVGTTNGAEGTILATAASGTSGNVSITNNLGALNVTLNDLVSADLTTGTGGSLTFNSLVGSVTVTGNSSGNLVGSVNASGTATAVLLARSNTTLEVGTIASSAGSLTVSVANGASSVDLALASSIVGTGGSVTITTPTINSSGLIQGSLQDVFINAGSIANDGVIESTAGGGEVVITSFADDLTITGVGTLNGPTITLVSGTDSVSALQDTITGTVGGSATTDFAVTANVSSLFAGNVATLSGTVDLTSAASSLTVVGDASITAGLDIFLTGETDVTIGSAVVGTTVNIISSANNLVDLADPFSTSMSDFNYVAITSPGGVLVTSVTGSITLNEGVIIDSFGESIGLMSANNLTFGNANDLFAQGANVWMQASNSLTMPAGTLVTSIARTTTGTVVIDGVTVPDFNGGGLAIFAGTSLPDYDLYLKDTAVNDRVTGGTYDPIGGPDTTGTPLVLGGNLINGAWVQLVVPALGSLALTNSIVNVNGGVLSIDPPGVIALAGVNFLVVGPALIPIPPPPPAPPVPPAQPPVVPVVIVTPTVPVKGPDPIIIPTDQTGTGKTGVTNELATIINSTAQVEQVADSNNVNSGTIFVSGSCQPFVFGYDDSTLFGCGGTEFKPSPGRTIDLNEGRMVAITQSKVLVIATGFGNVNVPADSAAVIDHMYPGVLRVASLAGQQAEVSVIGKDGTTKNMSAPPGEEVVISDESVAQEELIPIDGVDREPIGGKIAFAGLSVGKQKFDRKQMADREMLLNCNMGNMFISIKRQVDKLKQQMGAVTAASPGGSGGSPKATLPNNKILKAALPVNAQLSAIGGTNSSFNKVSFSGDKEMIAGGVSAPRTIFNDFAIAKYSGSTDVRFAESDVVVLEKGQMLVAAVKKIHVKSGYYVVEIAPGTIAFVDANDKLVKVRNMWEETANAVSVVANGKSVAVGSGGELVLGQTNGLVTAEVKADPVARRRVRLFDLPGAHVVARSEVSIVSLIQNSKLLSELVKSENESDRQLAEKMIKMAACLAQTTASHGPYSTTANK
jgi:hypothetical protein